MNDFIGYCLATKNYSAIKAVKMYGETAKKIAKGAAITTALGTGAYITHPGGRLMRRLVGKDTAWDKAHENVGTIVDTANKGIDVANKGGDAVNSVSDFIHRTTGYDPGKVGKIENLNEGHKLGLHYLLDKAEDSKAMRKLREANDETTLRDRVLNLWDKVTGKEEDKTKLDEFIENNNIKNIDDLTSTIVKKGKGALTESGILDTDDNGDN